MDRVVSWALLFHLSGTKLGTGGLVKAYTESAQVERLLLPSFSSQVYFAQSVIGWQRLARRVASASARNAGHRTPDCSHAALLVSGDGLHCFIRKFMCPRNDRRTCLRSRRSRGCLGWGLRNCLPNACVLTPRHVAREWRRGLVRG